MMDVLDQKTELSFEVISKLTQKSTIIYYHEAHLSAFNMHAQMDLPDTTMFENSNWYKLHNGRKIPTGFDTVTIKKTSEYKKILGYTCQKLALKGTEGNAQCWVCKDLPQNITPVNGWKPFIGAVLEYDDLTTGMTFVLRELHKEK